MINLWTSPRSFLAGGRSPFLILNQIVRQWGFTTGALILLVFAPILGNTRAQSIDQACRTASTPARLHTLSVLAGEVEMTFTPDNCDELYQKLSQVSALYLFGKHITDLVPLTPLTHLKKLSLRQNQITTITALQSLTRLSWLDISKNQISDLSPIQPLNRLTYLNAERNQLTDITAVSSFSVLEKLFISRNRIRDITPLQDLSQLTDLDISFNQISDMSSLKQAKQLVKVFANNNQIVDISVFTGHKKLRWLMINDNDIKTINALKLIDLRRLDLRNNPVEDLRVVRYHSYRRLFKLPAITGVGKKKPSEPDKIKQTSIPKEVPTEPQKHDKTNHNAIREQLPVEPEDAAKKDQSVPAEPQGILSVKIELVDPSPPPKQLATPLIRPSSEGQSFSPKRLEDGNETTKIIKAPKFDVLIQNPISLVFPEKSFDSERDEMEKDLTSLTEDTVDLSSTERQSQNLVASLSPKPAPPSVPEPILDLPEPEEVVIELDYVELCRTPSPAQKHTLEVLSKKVGLIYSPEECDGLYARLDRLLLLVIFNKELTDISPIGNLVNLKQLFLYNNQIEDISPLRGLTALQKLGLDNNRINTIEAVSHLRNLTLFSAYNNRIKDISPLKHLIRLRKLDLHQNQITDISALQDLKTLTWLSLDENRIKDISGLTQLSRLVLLKLNNNRISDLSGIGALNNLLELYVRQNEIQNVAALGECVSLRKLDIRDNLIVDFTSIEQLEYFELFKR